MQPAKPALQYSSGRSFVWTGAELVNCYAEKADGDKRGDFAVIATPGLTTWTIAGAGPIRGAIVCGGVLYVVSGTGFYSVSSGGAATLLSTIPGTGPVRIACNYSEVCIAANNTGYVWSGGVMSTPVPFNVSDVVYIDGYMLWTIAASEQFIISGLDYATVYDAADVASVEGAPDDVTCAVNSHRELLFFGTQTTEVYYNSGAADMPFERQGNAFIERGIFDRNSTVKIDNTVTFVGDDRVVYRMNGYTPERISTHAIEYLLRDATYARAWTYTLEGHKFYVLECDAGTVLYDHATGAWHKRASHESAWWRCNGAVDAYGKTLLTDRTTGNLYLASNDVYSEAGDTISMEIVLPAIEGARQRMTMYGFEVITESGSGNGAAPEPQIMLSYSDDGGRLWSREMWRPMGALGDYRRRAIWRRLGQFRSRQMKIRITDPAYRIVIGCWADVR